ncbi:polysaccharide pyruvyl transferase family protein [Amycolatopsis sp. GM8]|uniref:polysaccharide pyruvyl transferase family protein n=1 Tax=Amycolatopsis sp. GM8 TaxID=2896530 RepID=UPI001F33F9A5|nr:polysaccharide pyruvyl transferase family protein [Amycolatopsis sp. GM8]
MRVNDRPCYYLVSPAGYPNYGDELVAATWLRYLAKVAPEADVWLDCQAPGNARLLLGEAHPRVRYVDTLWRLCWAAPSPQPWEIAAWMQHAAHNPGIEPRLAAGIELLAHLDVVHVLGGGYLAGLWPNHIGLLAGAAAAARRSGARAALTGQGLWPAAPGAAPILRALASRFDIVDVRDEKSADLLCGDGTPTQVTMTCDDAFLGIDEVPIDPRPAPKYVVCLQSDASECGNQQLAALALSCLRSWGAHGDEIGIVEGIPGLDRVIFALFEHEIPGARFYPFSGVWADGLPVAADQTWISTRFHPHLLAAAHGAGGLAISVHADYYHSKHESLLKLGSPWTFAGAPELPGAVPMPVPAGFSADVVRDCQARKLAIARSVYPDSPH